MSRESKMEMRAQNFYCITFAYEWQIRNERRAKCVSFRCQFPVFKPSLGVRSASSSSCSPIYITYTCIQSDVCVRVPGSVCVCVSAIVQNPKRYVYECVAVWIVHQYKQKVGVVYNSYFCLCVCLWRCLALCACVSIPENTMTNVIKYKQKQTQMKWNTEAETTERERWLRRKKISSSSTHTDADMYVYIYIDSALSLKLS